MLPTLPSPGSPGASASIPHPAPVPPKAALAWPAWLWVAGLDAVLMWGSVGEAASPEGLWLFCQQPEGTKEPQLLLCCHVWPQQLSHQPPGSYLGGRCDLEGGSQALPTPVLRSGPKPILGVLLRTGAVMSPCTSPSQRLPHKVRKLYSALERLLVSAGPQLVPPETLILGFPVSPLLVLVMSKVSNPELRPGSLWPMGLGSWLKKGCLALS